MSSGNQLNYGVEAGPVSNVRTLWEKTRAASYNYVVVPLVKPSFKSIFDKCVAHERQYPGVDDPQLNGKGVGKAFFKEDLIVADASLSGGIVGKLSDWIDLDDEDETIRMLSEIHILQEFQWASHIGVIAICMNLPKSDNIMNTARVINQILTAMPFLSIWIRVDVDPADDDDATPTLVSKPVMTPWMKWNYIRVFCEHNTRLHCALQLPHNAATLPSPRKWFSEPVRAVITPATIFLTNSKGFPVLSKRHQQFVRDIMKVHSPEFIVSNLFSDDTLDSKMHHQNGGNEAYVEYIRHLHRTQPEPDQIETFASGYQDFLQAPLQPLMDHLESVTYETFEKDPVKYARYQEAVYKALLDRPENSTTVLMVVGAGRGPLMTCSIRAADAAKRKVKFYAIEKNPNAVVTLRRMNEEYWGGQVTVVHTDMRYWEAPEKADIMVSELLGSFGDNELSPECLDGAQKFLSETGISIPSRYTSYLAPMSSQKLWNEVTSYKDLEHVETPYVVKFLKMTELAEPKYVWEFNHPNPKLPPPQSNLGHAPRNTHNYRYSKLSFDIQNSSIVHGFAGYFDAILYKDVTLSINPKTHSEGMFSWFPIYFPIKTPIYVPRNTKVHAHFWRCGDSRKVWYEWSLFCEVPKSLTDVETKVDLSKGECVIGGATAVHNAGGRSYWIGL